MAESNFDPFGDFATQGYLRNHAGAKDIEVVKRLEANAVSGNLDKALAFLSRADRVGPAEVRETHRLLFKDVYPWAGQDRDKTAPNLAIRKGTVEFANPGVLKQYEQYGLEQGADRQNMRQNPGAVMGLLAEAHPFLDGNGRTIMAVHGELARRAGIHIAWEETSKTDYLTALSTEIANPRARALDTYLKPFVREGVRTIEDEARSLRDLPGLNRSETPVERPQEQSGTVSGQQERPTLTIVAGPNGAGKSTLTNDNDFPGEKIDPDAIARGINRDNPESVAGRAARIAIQRQKDLLEARESMVIETTLSDRRTLRIMSEAKEAGYDVKLHFVGVPTVEAAMDRVSQRVRNGGHDIPEEDQRRRFAKVFNNLPEAMARADETTLYDNTRSTRQVARIDRDLSTFSEPPRWATRAAEIAGQKIVERADNVTDIEKGAQRAYDAAKASGIPDQQLRSEVRKLDEQTQERAKQVAAEAKEGRQRPAREAPGMDL